MQFLNSDILFIRCSFELFCLQLEFHYLQFKLIFAILQIYPLVQFVLCRLCLLPVLLFQLYILLLIHLCLYQFISVIDLNVLWYFSHISVALPVTLNCSLWRYHSWSVECSPSFWGFACVTLVVWLRYLSALLIPIHNVVVLVIVVLAISRVPRIVVVDGKLELGLCSLYAVVTSFWFWHPVVCQWYILNILCIKCRWRNGFVGILSSTKSCSFADYWFQDFVNFHFTKSFFI